ncbi:MAG: complement resistance protein TraT [Gammaproteobacteria bacterium]|nr:complement resistance protein TraT [Gammaproteobacteria bacterium]
MKSPFALASHTTGILLLSTALLLSGCQALQTSIKKRNLDVQTKMSETIFLEPVKPADRIIYVAVKNTSDKDLNIRERIYSTLQQAGYQITDDPDRARFMLQGNVLQCGKSDLRSANSAVEAGWGGAWAGLAIAGATGSRSSSTYAGAGLLGAVAGVVGDALVDDTFYAMITDIEVRERPRAGETVTQTQDTSARQGTSTHLHQNISGGATNWKIYRTRIVSTANKANLDFAEAKPELESGLVRSISGVFVQ